MLLCINYFYFGWLFYETITVIMCAFYTLETNASDQQNPLFDAISIDLCHFEYTN